MSEQKKAKKRTKFMGYSKLGLFVVVMPLLLFVGRDSPMYAQSNDCTPIIAEQFKIVNSTCRELNSNWACYGHNTTVAAPTGARFNREGDRQPIEELKTITTTDPSGVAVIHLHLVDEEAPINVMLLGAAQLSSGGVNSFIMRNDNGVEICQNTPPGMVARTETGERGRITVNGVDIDLGSSAFITMRSNAQMEIVNIEGQVAVSVPGLPVGRQLTPGQQVGVTLTNGTPVTISVPVSSTVANSALLQWLANNENGLRKVVDPNTETVPNVPACGRAIAYGQTVTAKNSTAGQECLFTFKGAVGDIVGIQMATTAGTLNPWVDLRGPDHQLINFNNNVANNNLNSQLCNPGLPVSGQYTIVARSDQNATAGSFKLTLIKKTACPTPTPPRVIVTACHKAQPQGWIVYQVRPGDTLSGLAQRNRVNISQLMQVNCLASTVIKVGEPLFVPAPPCNKVQPRGWVAYRVSVGDTLSSLAQSRHTSIGQLIQVNCLTATQINVGEILFAPPLPPTVTPTTVTPCPGLEILSLSIDPTRRTVVFDWEAAGGCEPITGNLSVTFIGSDGEKTETVGQTDTPIRGSSGFLTVQQPTSPLCSLEAVYLFELQDSTGQHATTRGRQPLRNTCDGEGVTDVPPDTPTPTDTPTPIDTPTSIDPGAPTMDTPTPTDTPISIDTAVPVIDTPTSIDIPTPTDTTMPVIDTPVPPTDTAPPVINILPSTDTPTPAIKAPAPTFTAPSVPLNTPTVAPTYTPAEGSQAP